MGNDSDTDRAWDLLVESRSIRCRIKFHLLTKTVITQTAIFFSVTKKQGLLGEAIIPNTGMVCEVGI